MKSEKINPRSRFFVVCLRVRDWKLLRKLRGRRWLDSYVRVCGKKLNTMSDPSLIKIGKINLGELSKPATMLVKKISSACGVLYEPTRIRREAKANADVALIEADSRIQVGDRERIALTRFVQEQVREQQNIEGITTKALPNLDPESDPSKMDEDWVSNFFSKCRLVSDEEMQELWASLLAGEANKAGSISKRTVDFVAAMDKSEAEIFARLCRFTANSWKAALIFNFNDKILEGNELPYKDLAHLDTIGLIKLEANGFIREGIEEGIHIQVDGKILTLKQKIKREKHEVKLGMVVLTKIGEEMRQFVNFSPADGLYEYCVENWAKDNNCTLSSPYPNVASLSKMQHQGTIHKSDLVWM